MTCPIWTQLCQNMVGTICNEWVQPKDLVCTSTTYHACTHVMDLSIYASLSSACMCAFILSEMFTLTFLLCWCWFGCFTGNEMDRSTVTYTISGTPASIAFSAMFALGTIAFAFGDTILPEIQVCDIHEIQVHDIHENPGAWHSRNPSARQLESRGRWHFTKSKRVTIGKQRELSHWWDRRAEGGCLLNDDYAVVC